MMAGKITIGKKRALGLHRIVLPPSRSACSVSFSQAARKVRLQSDPQCELSTNSGAKADWPLAAAAVFTGMARSGAVAAIVPMGTKYQILNTRLDFCKSVRPLTRP